MNNRGVAIFAWLDDGSEISTDFVRSFAGLADDQIAHASARFAFEYFENVYMSPVWWEGLTKPQRDSIMKRLRAGADWTMHKSNCLLDDGMSIVNWNVIQRHTNVAGL
jgi:hypothetical protein